MAAPALAALLEELADFVLIAGVLVLIGMLLATRSTFTVLARILNVGIAGFHPFAFLADAIENYIIAALNSAIADLQHVLRDLWHLAVWSWGEMLAGMRAFIDGTEAAIGWLRNVHIPVAVRAYLDPIGALANAARALAGDAYDAVRGEVTARERAIERSAAATLQTATRLAAGYVDTVKQEIGGELAALRSAVEGELTAGLVGIGNDARSALDTLRAAEDAAIAAAEHAGAATAEEIRDVLAGLDPSTVAAIIASVPLLHAALQALEAETGLGNRECRDKVRGICSTPTSSWLRLLEGLALTAAIANLDDLLELFQEGAQLVIGEVVPMLLPNT